MLLSLPRFSTALAVILMLAGATAQATTVTLSTTLPTTAVANPIASGTIGAAVLAQNVTGTIVNDRRSPWDATNSTLNPTAATSLYSAIRSSKKFTLASAIFDFTTAQKELSFVWGTPGAQNKIEFFLNGVSQFVLFGGGAQTLSAGGSNSIFTTIADLSFDRVVLSADHRALEFANLRTVAIIPLPAGGLLLIGAIGGLAALRRRRSAA